MRIVSPQMILAFVIISGIFEVVLYFASSSGTTSTTREFLPSYIQFCREARSVNEIVMASDGFVRDQQRYDFQLIESVDAQICSLSVAHDSILRMQFKQKCNSQKSSDLSDSLVESCRNIRAAMNDWMCGNSSTELMKTKINQAQTTIRAISGEITSTFEQPLLKMRHAPFRSREASLGLLKMRSEGRFDDIISGKEWMKNQQ